MIRFIQDYQECQRLWEQFSPHERAWDEWELMYAFHDQQNYRLNFMAHESDGSIDGFIPLVEDTSDGSFELFGGCYPDSRELWIEIEHFAEFFEALPDKTVFFDLRGSWVDQILQRFPQYEANFTETDQQYYLVPADFDYDFVNHMQATFSSDKRKGFLRDLRKLKELHQVELHWNDADESDLFIKLSQKNFGSESDHSTEGGKQEVKRVISELKDLGLLRTLTVTVNGEKQAVSHSALYNNYWISLYASSNNDINNLGKLLNFETIQEGCRLRVREINYMTGMTWKAAWHMLANPCRTMRKPARATAAQTESTSNA